MVNRCYSDTKGERINRTKIKRITINGSNPFYVGTPGNPELYGVFCFFSPGAFSVTVLWAVIVFDLSVIHRPIFQQLYNSSEQLRIIYSLSFLPFSRAYYASHPSSTPHFFFSPYHKWLLRFVNDTCGKSTL